MQAPAPNTRPLRAPLRGAGMTRPNAAVALESAAKARAAMQTAQQRGAAAGGQPSPAPQAQAPQRAPQAAPQRQVAQAPQPARGAPVAYPNPEWNPRAQAAKSLQGLPVTPKVVPVAMPAGVQPAQKPGGNIYASMAPGDKKQALANLGAKQQLALSDTGRGEAVAPLESQSWALPYGDDDEEFDPLSGDGFMVPGQEVSDPLNDPTMWDDETAAWEEDYGTPAEQQAKQNEELAAQKAFVEKYGMTPEEMSDVVEMGDVDLTGLLPEGWNDTAALSGMDESDWANENNPGPGWGYNPDTGKWEQRELPPGVSADDPRWTFNDETGEWQLFEATEDDKLVDLDYMNEWAKGLIESDVEDHMNPELENQKKQAWDQAQAANLDVAKALGSRGIGASGLAGMGMGDVFKATQNNVQSLEFDEYTAAAERRLKEIQLALSGRQGDLSAETQKGLADEAAELEKYLAETQYAREDRDDIWAQIDNMAAGLEREAGKGWDVDSLNAFKAWASTPGNDPYKAVFDVEGEKIIFLEEASNARVGGEGKGGPKEGQPWTEYIPEAPVAPPQDNPAAWTDLYDAYVEEARAAGQYEMTFGEWLQWNIDNMTPEVAAKTGFGT